MIILKGRVHKVTEEGCCHIVIPNDSSISDVIQVWTDKLTQGQPVEISITPLKVNRAGAGFLSPVIV